MSGQPYKTPIDIAKFRNEYLSNLALQASINEANFKANQIYTRTGAPSQPTDTRTTEEKLNDLYRLRIELRSRLGEIMSGDDANNVAEGLDENEARFVAQQIDTLIKDIKPKYRLGIPADAFNEYLRRYMQKFNDTQGVEYGLQQQTGEQLLANQGTILGMLPNRTQLNRLAEIIQSTGEMQGSVVVRQLDYLKKVVEDLPRVFDMVNTINNAVIKDDIIASIGELANDLPTATQLESLMRELLVAVENKDRSYMNRVLFKLNELTSTTGQVGLEVSSLNDELEGQKIDPIPEPSEMVVKEKEIPFTTATTTATFPEQLQQETISIGGNQYTFFRDEVIRTLPLSSPAGNVNLMDYIQALRKVDPVFTANIFNNGSNSQIKKQGVQYAREVILSNNEAIREMWDVYARRDLPVATSPTSSGKGISFGLNRQGRYPNGINPHKKIMKGRGLTIDYSAGIPDEPEYVPFGKYIVSRKKLADGILMIKRHNGQFINDFRTKRISPNLTNVFKKVAGGSLPTFGDLEKLDDEEREYLRYVANKSNLSAKLEIPSPKKDKNEALINQFEIMRGQLIAGNDSKELIKKFKQVIVDMLDNDLIPKGQAKDILVELARKDY